MQRKPTLIHTSVRLGFALQDFALFRSYPQSFVGKYTQRSIYMFQTSDDGWNFEPSLIAMSEFAREEEKRFVRPE